MAPDMLCSCQTNSTYKRKLKRPSRPAPAPPVPPKDTSLSCAYDLNFCHRYSHKTYSEGPRSVSCMSTSGDTTRSLQTTCCNSAQSESEYLSTASDYGPPCCSLSCRPAHQYQMTQCVSIARSSIYQSHYSSGYETNSQKSYTNTLPPVPLERKNVPRPKISISPVPILKNTGKQPLPRSKCEPLSYKRHIEQQIERLFKYLKERKKRLEECDYAIRTKTTSMHPKDQLQAEKTIRDLLVNKETRYLRSLRTPMSAKFFKELKRLGAGHIGNVWLVEKKDPYKIDDGEGEIYAMKKLKKSQVFKENHMAHIMAERDILAEADNAWIVKLFFSFQDELYLYFILEYVPGGDLMNLLYMRNVFHEEWARFYIAEISLALQYVHDMNFIHRDIKPDNILIDRRGHIKLTDFGLCTGFRWTHDKYFYTEDSRSPYMPAHDDHPTITKELTRRELEYSTRPKKMSVVGSPNYIAPEVLDPTRQLGKDEKLCDWWSVGVILYEMVCGFCPFINLKELKAKTYRPDIHDVPIEVQMRILNWRQHLEFPGEGPSSPPLQSGRDENGEPIEPYQISENAKSLIRGWICDPRDRLCKGGIADIKNHPFFNGIDWQGIRDKDAPYTPILDGAKDTRHFDLHYPENEATIGGLNLGPRMEMYEFTYRNFWDKQTK